MFPIPWNKAFRKKDGTLVNMEDMGGGGGGGSFTPDYENEILVVGTQGDWEYYVPMSKRYVGEGIFGYQITTNSTSSSLASIDLYSLIYTSNGQIVGKTFIKTLTTAGPGTWAYEDDYISVKYENLKWDVTLLQSMYNTSGVAYQSPLQWAYSTQADYILLTEDPTQE